MSARVQRLRITYSRDDEVKYVSHLDMMRFWERALRRAHVPVSYSEGFTPHAQIALAAPLSVGMTSRGELMDLFLAEPWQPAEFIERVSPQLPRGIHLLDVMELPVAGPSVQSQLRAVEYALTLDATVDFPEVEGRVVAFLSAATFPWEHVRDKETKRYDLRPLVLGLRADRLDQKIVVLARLQAAEGGTARPDQVLAALGLADRVISIDRTALILEEPVPQP